MSTAKVSFAELPEAGEVKFGDFFVVEDVSIAKKINFKNLIFGLENVTFASTISSQSTDIGFLSASVDSLSGQVYTSNNDLTELLNTTVQSATAAFINVVYPVGTVIYTQSPNNPGLYISNTTWSQIAQGLFIAGIGSGVDRNGVGFTVGEGNATTNFNIGEYRHILTVDEMPAHTHIVQPIEGTNSRSKGLYIESAPVPGANLAPLETTFTGGSQPHNNIPPLYGLYVWERIS
jgi:hypothetical protein